MDSEVQTTHRMRERGSQAARYPWRNYKLQPRDSFLLSAGVTLTRPVAKAAFPARRKPGTPGNLFSPFPHFGSQRWPQSMGPSEAGTAILLYTAC